MVAKRYITRFKRYIHGYIHGYINVMYLLPAKMLRFRELSKKSRVYPYEPYELFSS